MSIGTFGLIGIAFGMATDAFAVAVVRGTSHVKVRLSHALKVGLIFGITEMLMPLVGYFLGMMAHEWVAQIDHWISFVLLMGLGMHLLYETWHDETQIRQVATSFGRTLLTAFATSIDALIIGVSLAFLGANIWLACVLIGLVSFMMSATGVFLGSALSKKVGKIAQIMGAFVLMLIGVLILVSHLGYVQVLS